MRLFSLAHVVVILFISEVYSVELSPQVVVDRILQKDPKAHLILYKFEKEKIAEYQVKSKFDFGLAIKSNYEFDRADSITGQGNVEDDTLKNSLALNKKIKTGTNFVVEYEQIAQKSILGSYSVAGQNSAANQNLFKFKLEQDLLSNYFGASDRANIEITAKKILIAELARDEEFEKLVLDGLRMFWSSYVAKAAFKEALATLDKYKNLVEFVQKKARLNFTTPGELAQVEAEYALQEQKVKTTSLGYLQTIDQLLSTLDLKTEEDVDFVIGEILPAVPTVGKIEITHLREMQVVSERLAIANMDLAKSIPDGLPVLTLSAGGFFSGVDSDSGKALSEMASGNRPNYYVGINFQTVINSQMLKGEKLNRQIAVWQNQKQKEEQERSLINQGKHLARLIEINYQLAQSTIKMVELRERSLKEQDVGFKQGRLDLNNLIRAYNDFFQAQLLRIKSIGEYHMALNELAAFEDKLVERNL
ncbi:MAG: hypothetical protein A2504_04285 [Bdellovibrionales bacterium RIFOXYD12_FULL_39_22]|nr:MAG: hypothetical protein A2385_07540 [Bdellovibrionales bacterium RIFOXYB1_FULL_39_21]OFZ42112.1 MAG: hypothetical protein A2485_09510 [Bdellovibrionales bacterium RIFOXYC12_FULL_39_17]OFZ50828.1 MAG: hypothetical protein A2404_06460 [Bdellovibrionales bacterium RIFOXYC1_FULL_39_130]OFZ73607.1 MAG: hypothetical protein A2451_06245 [Bdellovibrionales bacterium RIFOXYC2_FULL_39_8]OFZ78051.1 MAG: hypothetical protein A2560_01630 [Bdellovibrionales bacterium RIFOXYD1_FULL_39_84]OFZ93513.1 MAG: